MFPSPMRQFCSDVTLLSQKQSMMRPITWYIQYAACTINFHRIPQSPYRFKNSHSQANQDAEHGPPTQGRSRVSGSEDLFPITLCTVSWITRLYEFYTAPVVKFWFHTVGDTQVVRNSQILISIALFSETVIHPFYALLDEYLQYSFNGNDLYLLCLSTVDVIPCLPDVILLHHLSEDG